jgi:hypothetical protein
MEHISENIDKSILSVSVGSVSGGNVSVGSICKKRLCIRYDISLCDDISTLRCLLVRDVHVKDV